MSKSSKGLKGGPEDYRMMPCMRWYGPQDGVSLTAIRQAGAAGIVTALHQIPPGQVWETAAIRERQRVVREAGMEWVVVESLPVSEAIKQQKGDYLDHIANYQQSIRNLAACGIRVITYNFMPVLDWVRTELEHPNPDGTRTLRFDRAAFAWFDIHSLGRPGADADYDAGVRKRAAALDDSLGEERRNRIRRSVLQGLPGSDEHFTEAALMALLADYDRIPESRLRKHLIEFLEAVVPVAEASGAVLAVHPDDPPYPLLGLPRVVSGHDHLQKLFDAVPSVANGLCFCTGSLGAGKTNDLPSMVDAFGERIHFLHLRNVAHEADGAFRESDHLDGHVPMEEVVSRLLRLMARRGLSLPMRPDHGFLHELEHGSKSYPGYSLTGRLKGLAELRGLEKGLLYAG
ncbi:mannonate dehydratase [Robiginitalea biformata]|nr:mannonate dehydratase [Robiginitalea biformata]